MSTDDIDPDDIGWCHVCGQDIYALGDHAPGCLQSNLGPGHPMIGGHALAEVCDERAQHGPAQPYGGPFDPPPASVLEGAAGWRHVKVDDGPGRWRPNGWQVVYPDHILTLDANGMGVVDSVLWAP